LLEHFFTFPDMTDLQGLEPLSFYNFHVKIVPNLAKFNRVSKRSSLENPA